jgi:hypothetical protein
MRDGGPQDVKLRTPAPLPDDDVYRFATLSTSAVTGSLHPANSKSPVRNGTRPLASTGDTPKTIISDPVVVRLTGSGSPPATDAEADSSAHQTGNRKTIDLGEPQPGASSAIDEAPGAAPQTGGEPGARTGAAAPRIKKLRTRRRRRVRLRYLMQAWGVSLIVHVAILSALAAATFSAKDSIKKIVSFDSALASSHGELELLPIYADPDTIARDKTIGDENATTPGEPAPMMLVDGGSDGDDGGGMIVAGGTARTSNTPRVRGVGKGRINEGSSLPGVKVDGLGGSPLTLLPAAHAADLSGGGKIAGDPVFDVKEIGVALDQLAHEILRHLKEHKLTVVWLFDESASMQDDQRTILEKFDRVSSELKLNIEPNKKAAGALSHAIVGFGQATDYVLEKPREDVDLIGKGIKNLKIDPTGIENTMTAVREVVEHYAHLIHKDRKLLIVLVTDESGDDGADVEEAQQALKKHNVPLYVIGRQALFGYPYAHHEYIDPVTKDLYHPLIRRGPETADFELYQWDGLHERWDEQPSGFAPYELARLTKVSGGIYFLLPSEEFMRMRKREKAYSITQLKEYMPEYVNRLTYVERRSNSALRQTLHTIIANSKSLLYVRDFSIESERLVQSALEQGERATFKLNALIDIQNQLENLKKLRDRETEKRWQAHYDLMLAQTVAFECIAYEYRALMASIVKSPPVPKQPAGPNEAITWRVDHSKTPLAPRNETAKKYAEAERLLNDVIARHPKTPWADLAQDTINNGFSVHFHEWHHNPKYAERAQYVPKY